MLEIGTGSGYQAAVLAEMAKQVYSIEIVPELAERARRALAETGYRNVDVRTGNGYLGWPDRAPFDRIIVTAAPPEIPKALVEQLAVGGIMVVPVGTDYQEIVVINKSGGWHDRNTHDWRAVCAHGAATLGERPRRDDIDLTDAGRHNRFGVGRELDAEANVDAGDFQKTAREGRTRPDEPSCRQERSGRPVPSTSPFDESITVIS